MSYFLKKTKKKKGTYLQIYEGHFSIERGHVVQTCYKSIGYLEELIASGEADPLTHYQREVDVLNEERKEKKSKNTLIGERGQSKYAGYFPVKAILDHLEVATVMDILQESRNFEFRTYEVLSALVFSRLIDPRSKRATVNFVLSDLFTHYDFSYDQVLDAVEYLGNDYEKYVELFTRKVQGRYGYNTKNTYFDCTNYYFEIDREDEFRKKGPSKENRHDPLVGMGLLLDSDLIPIGMKLYPGNENEQKYLREVISGMKEKGHVKGKTVQVADKGLNSATNIYEALSNGDGYIFSKSIKNLAEAEQQWVFNEGGWQAAKTKSGEVSYSYKEGIDTFSYSFIDERSEKKEFRVKEKRVVTYNGKLAKKQKAELTKLAEKAMALSYFQAKKKEFGDAGKYMDFHAVENEKEKVIAVFNQKKFDQDLKYAGYNMIVTSELDMKAQDIYTKYHELWRIEESFRILKSYLKARPVFLQKQEAIQGHFLICYVAVLLLRLFQIKELGDQFTTDEIITFIKDLQLVKRNESEYLNTSHASRFIDAYSKLVGIPLNLLYLPKKYVQKMHLQK